MIINFIKSIGNITLKIMNLIGNLTLFALSVIASFFRSPFYFKNIFEQIKFIGFYSLPVVGLTAIFTGAVLALQSYTSFSRFSAESAIATVVVLSITRELGPVLAGLMVAGRVGASIAAEIGTMKVTEQVDALVVMSTDPVKYLFAPRIIASIIVLPLLVMIADIIGVMGGYLVATYNLDFNPVIYLQNTAKYLKFMDVVSGLVKSAVFGFIIATIGCYFGANSGRGAQGVGRATTSAVVVSSILILLSNYILTKLFF